MPPLWQLRQPGDLALRFMQISAVAVSGQDGSCVPQGMCCVCLQMVETPCPVFVCRTMWTS
jgi:hypothetical protein